MSLAELNIIAKMVIVIAIIPSTNMTLVVTAILKSIHIQVY